jgi:Ser/Thr protein kinase RdoA (MazF antagonist)
VHPPAPRAAPGADDAVDPAADAIPPHVRGAYGVGPEARVTPVSIGLINRTLRVDGARAAGGHARLVLQRLHPVFAAEVNEDIDAITAHLAARGVPTPRVVRAHDGALSVRADDGVWRALTFVEGRCLTVLSDPAVARVAGAGVARFHLATADLRHVFRFTRPGAHDTQAHLATLRQALADHAGHRLAPRARPVAEALLAHGEALPDTGGLPERIVHGDLKVTNLLFDEALTRVEALVDLDTLAHGTIATELGDALRSWCNPGGESADTPRVDERLLRAALEGYADAAPGLLSEREALATVDGLETIAVELAARFCADALAERYFGWDAARFASRGEHNLARAAAMQRLAADARARRDALREVAAAAFRGKTRR